MSTVHVTKRLGLATLEVVTRVAGLTGLEVELAGGLGLAAPEQVADLGARNDLLVVGAEHLQSPLDD